MNVVCTDAERQITYPRLYAYFCCHGRKSTKITRLNARVWFVSACVCVGSQTPYIYICVCALGASIHFANNFSHMGLTAFCSICLVVVPDSITEVWVIWVGRYRCVWISLLCKSKKQINKQAPKHTATATKTTSRLSITAVLKIFTYTSVRVRIYGWQMAPTAW